ncbi:MAG: energy transducer TonB [Alphaproteobacteria bacterium]
MFWVAFVCAVGIHLAAVVIGRTNVESTKIESFTLPAGDVDVIETEPEPMSPDDSVTPPPLQPISPDEEFFSDENFSEPKIRPRKRTRSASVTKGATAVSRFAKAMVTYAPRPVYPYEARRLRITGSGTAVLTIDPALGNVTDALMVQSCGNAILDRATLDAFRRWRFKPGTAVRVQVPITYTLTGVSY